MTRNTVDTHSVYRYNCTNVEHCVIFASLFMVFPPSPDCPLVLYKSTGSEVLFLVPRVRSSLWWSNQISLTLRISSLHLIYCPASNSPCTRWPLLRSFLSIVNMSTSHSKQEQGNARQTQRGDQVLNRLRLRQRQKRWRRIHWSWHNKRWRGWRSAKGTGSGGKSGKSSGTASSGEGS